MVKKGMISKCHLSIEEVFGDFRSYHEISRRHILMGELQNHFLPKCANSKSNYLNNKYVEIPEPCE